MIKNNDRPAIQIKTNKNGTYEKKEFLPKKFEIKYVRMRLNVYKF